MSQKRDVINAISLLLLIGGMFWYVGWIFQKSEPTYMNNPTSERAASLQLYDVISLRPNGDPANWLDVVMVIQIDSTSLNNNYALVKSLKYSDEFKDVPLNKLGEATAYKLIGRGTFYHKVNHFVGFNIMFITTIVIALLGVVLFICLVNLVYDVWF